ncbi:MAG: signal peptidase II [Balneolaceae bacterium]|nr:signal peptidase II [Balneolaceae bacterium]
MDTKKLSVLLAPAIVVVIVDQLTKYWVRTTPSLQNWEIISGWLAFHYTQNPGMALGMNWISTPVISVIAIIATLGILAYILNTMHKVNTGYLFCMSLILGGALGNIIDRLAMAQIEGYGGMLEGHVVDFIHFTLEIQGYPVFPYIFNVADVAISTAIISLIVFNKRILHYGEEDEVKETILEADNPELKDGQ